MYKVPNVLACSAPTKASLPFIDRLAFLFVNCRVNPLWLRRKWRAAKRRWPQKFSDDVKKRRDVTRTAWKKRNSERVKAQARIDYQRRKRRLKSDPEFLERYTANRIRAYKKMMSDPVLHEKRLAGKRLSHTKRKPDSLRRKAYLCSYERKRRSSDVGFRVRCQLACRVRLALRGIAKASRTVDLLGCDIASFIAHLESQWTPGMNWSNYGAGPDKWVIDHIKPCAAFDLRNPIEQSVCFHYSNLRPCWYLENLSKSSRWNGKLHRYNRSAT